MQADLRLQVDDLSKKYCKSLRRTMLYGLLDVCSSFVGLNPLRGHLRRGEFWGLRDASFELREGEWLGVVGANGSGKTTLLKLLTGLLRPDLGRIEVRGRVGALIELGAGFHPLLTGRENILLQGAVLGLGRREIEERFEPIVEFAGIGEFLDVPVKFYSSGMHARLGFSIAVHTDPDVLLVDEVLAVGDIAFQEKCMRRMESMRRNHCSVLMVQQHTYWIEALCDRAIWLDRGRIVRIGAATEVVRAYLDDQDQRLLESAAAELSGHEPHETPARIERVELLGDEGHPKEVFRSGETMTVRMHYHARRKIEWPLFNLRVFHRGMGILEASMLIDGPEIEAIEGRGIAECRLGPLPLTPKVYEIKVFARSKEGVADILPMRTYAVFRISEHGLDRWALKGPMAINHLRQGSPVYVPRSWRFVEVDEEVRA